MASGAATRLVLGYHAAAFGPKKWSYYYGSTSSWSISLSRYVQWARMVADRERYSALAGSAG